MDSVERLGLTGDGDLPDEDVVESVAAESDGDALGIAGLAVSLVLLVSSVGPKVGDGADCPSRGIITGDGVVWLVGRANAVGPATMLRLSFVAMPTATPLAIPTSVAIAPKPTLIPLELPI